jgi:hypothetical protein
MKRRLIDKGFPQSVLAIPFKDGYLRGKYLDTNAGRLIEMNQEFKVRRAFFDETPV